MKDHILIFLYIFLLFLLYFGFQINGINTRYLATGLLLVLCICIPSSLTRLSIIKEPVFMRPIKSIVMYNFVVMAIAIGLMTMDFTMLTGTIRILICMIDVFLLWALLPPKYRDKQIYLLITIYVLQSIIICLAFLSPDFLNIVRGFQFESVIEKTDNYLFSGTFRGLALAGDQFYGLTASFGLISLIVMKLYVDSYNTKWIIIFLLLFAANMFVGRTGIIGFVAAIGYLILSAKKNKFKLFFKIITITILLVLILYLILPSSLKQIIDESVFAYAFQIFYNYRDYGTFSTSSSDRVAEMWQISIGFFTFLIGDGKFTNPDGSYYGHVDVGFLRQILYGGIFFLGYSIISTWHLLINYSKKYNMRQYLFEYIVFAYLLVTHAKGLSFMYCPEQMLIILFYYLHLNNTNLRYYK